MRVVYFLASVALAAMATLAIIGLLAEPDVLMSDDESQASAWAISISMLLGSVLIFVAGLKSYRGGWPYLIGIGHGVFAVALATWLATATFTIDEMIGLVLFAVLIGASSIALLYSGHKLHKLSSSKIGAEVFE